MCLEGLLIAKRESIGFCFTLGLFDSFWCVSEVLFQHVLLQNGRQMALSNDNPTRLSVSHCFQYLYLLSCISVYLSILNYSIVVRPVCGLIKVRNCKYRFVTGSEVISLINRYGDGSSPENEERGKIKRVDK